MGITLVPRPYSTGRSTRSSDILHGFFLLSFQNAFPLPMVETALNLELIGTFYLCVLSKQLFLVPFHLICLFVFSFS